MNDSERRWVGKRDDLAEHGRTDDAVRWNEERYRTLFDLGPVAVYSSSSATTPIPCQRPAESKLALTNSVDTAMDVLNRQVGQMVRPRGLRILIVDDYWDAAEMLAIYLHQEGHETHTAHDGVEAIEATTRVQPDLVLLDIGLPRLNGYEAARRIREQYKDSAGPALVALSGWGQDEDRRRSKEAGFDAHLVKPVDMIALCKLLFDLGARKQEVTA